MFAKGKLVRNDTIISDGKSDNVEELAEEEGFCKPGLKVADSCDMLNK